MLLLLTALFLVGVSFQILVRNYLNRQALDNLENDGKAIATLASAYYTEASLTGKDFFINLSVATRVSDADAVLFDTNGRLLLCSDSPFGCEHRGWVVNRTMSARCWAAASPKIPVCSRVFITMCGMWYRYRFWMLTPAVALAS
jgi:hypothetical protein